MNTSTYQHINRSTDQHTNISTHQRINIIDVSMKISVCAPGRQWDEEGRQAEGGGCHRWLRQAVDAYCDIYAWTIPTLWSSSSVFALPSLLIYYSDWKKKKTRRYTMSCLCSYPGAAWSGVGRCLTIGHPARCWYDKLLCLYIRCAPANI